MFSSSSTRSSSGTPIQAADNTVGYRTPRASYTRRHSINSITSSDEEDFELFLNRSWDVYNVSPLYRLEYSDIHLKRCSKWLREQIINYVSEKKKDYQYIVEFSVIKSIIGNSDGKSLRVQIQTKFEDKTAKLYEGIFLSTENEPAKLHPSLKYLPTLIARCSQDTANIVHGLLQRLFDCKIHKIYLNTNNFKWLIALFCTDLNFFRISKSVTLTLHNRLLDTKSSINLEMPLQSLADIWDSVISGDNVTITSEEVEEFHSVLNLIINKFYQINVEKLHFTKIKMSHFSVYYPFKINIRDSGLLKELLLNTTRFFQ